MNTKSYPAGLLWLALATTGILLFSGCQTPPKQYAHPEAGFLVSRYWSEVKGKTQQTEMMNYYARSVAEARLATFKSGDTLPDLRRYRQHLKTPIQISPEVLDQEAGLSKSQHRAISDWLQATPAAGTFDGEKASDVWQQKLAWADKQIRQLSAQLGAALDQAKEKLAAGLFEQAEEQSKIASGIDPEDPGAQALARDLYRKWTTSKCDELLASMAKNQSEASAQTKNYETDQFSTAAVEQCETSLNQGQTQIDRFLAWCDQNANARAVLGERQTEINQVQSRLAGLRGTTWAQKIWLLRRQHHYWDAYQYYINASAVKELDLGDSQKHRLLDLETSAIHQRLREAYERMLPEGMEFYIRNAAGAAEGDGANGLALILCRMAQELMEFGQAQQMQILPGAEQLRPTLDLSLTKAEAALQASLTRQLIVKDFRSPSDIGHSRDDIGQELASQIYDEWMERFPGNNPGGKPVPFWMLNIKRDAEKIGALDYVLSGTVQKCYAETLPPKELNVERLEIGLEPQQIPNPDPKTAKKIPTIFEQELWIYEQRTSQCAKEAFISADITVACGNKEPTTCADVHQMFDDVHAKLPNIKLMDKGVENRAINYKPKQSVTGADLRVDKLPPNKMAELSSDREIEAALRGYAKDQVLTNLEVYVSLFPLNNLFQEGLSNASNPVKAAEGFGRCVEYCSQLAALDKNLAANTGGNWPAWREAMTERIAQLKREQWRNADPHLLSLVDKLWELAVAAAIQAADQTGRAD